MFPASLLFSSLLSQEARTQNPCYTAFGCPRRTSHAVPHEYQLYIYNNSPDAISTGPGIKTGRCIMNLAATFLNVVGLGSNKTSRPSRAPQQSGARIIKRHIPTQGPYLLFQSEIQTGERRSTHFDPIPCTDEFDLVEPKRIGPGCDDCDVYSTGVLERAIASGFNIWIITEDMDAQLEWMLDLGIPRDHIIDVLEIECEPCDCMLHAVVEAYRRMDLGNFLPGKLPKDYQRLVDALWSYQVRTGTNVPEPLPVL